MKGKHLGQQNVNRLGRGNTISSLDFIYDFSKMSIDELLESARTHIGPKKTDAKADAPSAGVEGVAAQADYLSLRSNNAFIAAPNANARQPARSAASPVAASRTARPTASPIAESRAARPTASPIATYTAARLAASPVAASRTARPAASPVAASGAARPTASPAAASGAAKPTTSPIAASTAARSAASPIAASTAARSAALPIAASTAARPVASPIAASTAARPAASQVSIPDDDAATAATPDAPERRRFGFYKALLLFVMVMIVAICAGTFFLWGYIEAYEASLPEHIIQSLQDNIDYDFWERSVAEALVPLLTEFESDGNIPPEQYRAMIRDVRYTVRQKSDEGTADALVYIIRAGPRDIGIARLVPTQDLGYGFSRWEVGSIELLDSFVGDLSKAVSITASQNAQVEVNRVPVSQDYRVDCDIEYGATYLIPRIFGEVEVSVSEFDGRKSVPYYAQNGDYLYPVISPFTRKFNIVVPVGSALYLDGRVVPQEYITNNSIIPGIFAGVVEQSTVPLLLRRYEFEISGLYSEPILTALDPQGGELLCETSRDGEIVFNTAYSPEYKARHEAAVEAFIRAYVRYGANIGNSIEANFANVSGHMLPGSELYARVWASMDGIMWVSGATVEYHSLEIDNFRPYGDRYFTCEVRYKITNRTYYEAREVEGNYEILFVLSGDRWLAAKMVNL